MRIVPFALVLAACSNSFKADGLDLSVDAIEYSFVGSDSVASTEEGGPSLNGLAIVLTDQADLCDQLAGNDINDIDDGIVVLMVAMRVGGSWDSVDTNASIGDIFFAGEEGDQLVGVRAVERSGGVTIGDYATRNMVDLAHVSDSSLWVSSQSLASGEIRSMGGSFEARLQADLTDPTTFDTDVSNDEEPDFLAISESVKGKFTSADPCSNLSIF